MRQVTRHHRGDRGGMEKHPGHGVGIGRGRRQPPKTAGIERRRPLPRRREEPAGRDLAILFRQCAAYQDDLTGEGSGEGRRGRSHAAEHIDQGIGGNRLKVATWRQENLVGHRCCPRTPEQRARERGQAAVLLRLHAGANPPVAAVGIGQHLGKPQDILTGLERCPEGLGWQ